MKSVNKMILPPHLKDIFTDVYWCLEAYWCSLFLCLKHLVDIWQLENTALGLSSLFLPNSGYMKVWRSRTTFLNIYVSFWLRNLLNQANSVLLWPGQSLSAVLVMLELQYEPEWRTDKCYATFLCSFYIPSRVQIFSASWHLSCLHLFFFLAVNFFIYISALLIFQNSRFSSVCSAFKFLYFCYSF